MDLYSASVCLIMACSFGAKDDEISVISSEQAKEAVQQQICQRGEAERQRRQAFQLSRLFASMTTDDHAGWHSDITL